MSGFKCKSNSGLALKLESGVNLTENCVVCMKKQTVHGTRETWSYMAPENHVALEIAAMELYMLESSCRVNVREVEKKGAASRGTNQNKIIF